MFNTFGKLLCAVALAGAALAQGVTIVSPAAGTTLYAGASIVVEVEELPSSNSVEEVAVVLGIVACPGNVCPGVTQYLGDVLYNGPYTPKSINGAGNVYENLTVFLPSFTDGPAQLGIAHFSVSGAYATPELNYATTPVFITNAVG